MTIDQAIVSKNVHHGERKKANENNFEVINVNTQKTVSKRVGKC